MFNLNYQDLINLKSRKIFIIFIFLFLIIILIILSFRFKVYSTHKYYGIVNSELIILNLPMLNSDTIKNGEFVKVEDENYNYEIISYGTIINDYQEVYIKVDNNDFKENEILTIDLYYDKERIIEKIIETIF